MSAPVEKLKEARELVARPGGWTQGTFAETAEGTAVNESDPSAVAFCMMGACLRVGGGLGTIDLLRPIIGQPATWQDQDGRTQAEVVAAFDRAIALAEVANV